MKNTLDILRLAVKIIESWEDCLPSEIEKDMVLENLSKAYRTLKFLTEEPQPHLLTGQPEAYFEPEPDAPAQGAKMHTLEVTQMPSGGREIPGSEQPSLIVNSPDEQEEFAENILFTPEEMPAKAKLDKRAILSLYGDEPVPAKEQESCEAAPVAAVASQPEDKPAMHTRDDSGEPVQVLGDVLGTSGQRVADIYSETNTKTDVASVLSSGKVDGIRKSIGINDKFLMIRNLFDGDAELYENVISTLDGFDDLDLALIYIHENFNWNPDDQAVKLIVDLLTRKLS